MQQNEYFEDIFSFFPETEFEYPVRLYNGQRSSEGTVEVFMNDTQQWGMVCDYGWGMPDANVVCRMLGYAGKRETHTGTDLPGLD